MPLPSPMPISSPKSISSPMPSPQRIALVTGATSGIGAATCTALAARGVAVVAATMPGDPQAEGFGERHGLPLYTWSVCDWVACADGVARIEAEVGPIDILVNNAGLLRTCGFAKLTEAEWRAVIDTNLGGCCAMAHAVYPGMVARGWGRIVNLSAVAAQIAQYGEASYIAAKAGIIGLTRAIAGECGQSGVTVNAVAPGFTDSGLAAGMPPGQLRALLGQVPLGRLAKPAEIAVAIAFLCSEEASFVTGATVPVNGGLFMN